MRRAVIVVMVASAAPASALADDAPPLEAAFRGGYEDVSHNALGVYERTTDAGPWIDGEVGVRVAPQVVVLGFASHAWLPDPATDAQHEMGYSYKDSRVAVTDFGLRVHYRADDGPYIGGGLGYELAQFSTVYTDLMSGVYEMPQSYSHSSVYVEAHLGFRGPRLEECRCSIDLFASVSYSSIWIKANSFTDAAVITGRIAAGIAFW